MIETSLIDRGQLHACRIVPVGLAGLVGTYVTWAVSAAVALMH